MGTSGFAYKEWIGPFYPPGTKSAGMLGYYAGQFGSVEVNYTFRRSPTTSMIQGWSAATPEGFVFALKANQGITHFARLKDTGERLDRFLEAVTPLGPRLGPVLFQCPPNLKYDPEVLDGFLADLAAVKERHGSHRYAMEFRQPAKFLHTGAFAYVRLRGTGYDEKALEGWGASFRSTLEEGVDVYAYLKHEDSATGPRDAAILKRMAH